MVSITEGLLQVAIEIWRGWDLNPSTTEFRSAWAIRPWVPLALRANFLFLFLIHMTFTTKPFFESAIKNWRESTTEFSARLLNFSFRCSNKLIYQAMSSTRTQSELSIATSISSTFLGSHLIPAIAFVSRPFYFNRNLVEVITWV